MKNKTFFYILLLLCSYNMYSMEKVKVPVQAVPAKVRLLNHLTEQAIQKKILKTFVLSFLSIFR